MKKTTKNSIPITSILIIIFVLTAGILAYFINLRINASGMGEEIGTGLGSLVGKAVGSLEGITNGRIEGIKAGREAGLSAKDTQAEISTQLQQVEKLEVLVASVKLSNFHTIGEDISYAALYLVNGNVVFSVDLSQAIVSENENGEVRIELPLPSGNLFLDENTVNKVAEYQKKFFDGSAEDGYNAYLKSMIKVQEASEKTLDNYDMLITSAKNAAEQQIEQLVMATSSTAQKIVFEWVEREGQNE